MQAVGQQITYEVNRHKGLNRDNSSYNMGFDYAYDINNGYAVKTVGGRGYVEQRWGVERKNILPLHDEQTKIRYLFEATWSNGKKNLIVRAYDGWYRLNKISNLFEPLDVGRTIDIDGQAVMWDDFLVMVDSGKPRKSDSNYTLSDLSLDANMPQGSSAVWLHDGRLWLNEIGARKVHGSKILDATSDTAWTYGGGNKVEILLSKLLGKADEAIAFRSFGDGMLVIYCKEHIIIYYAPEVYSNIRWVDTLPVGSLSAKAINYISNDMAFPGKTGIKSLYSTAVVKSLNTKDLSGNVAKMYQEYIKSVGDYQNICGTFFSGLNHYYLTLPGLEQQTLVYCQKQKNIVGRFQFNGFTPCSWLERSDGSLWIGGDDGYVYKYAPEYFSDNGKSINFSWTPPYLGIDRPKQYKTLKESFFLMQVENAPATIFTDYYFAISNYVSQEMTRQKTLIPTAQKKLFEENDPNVRGRGRFIGVTLKNYIESNENISLGSRIRLTSFALRANLGGSKPYV